LTDLRAHRFFADVNWDRVRARAQENPPFIPNASKHRNLLPGE
jgi:hypothetical protein